MQLHLNSYGLYLHVKDDMFEIKHADKDQLNHVAAHKVKTIHVHKGMALSTDAILLALKHNIDIVLMDWGDRPAGRFWHSKLGSTTKIRKKQLESTMNHVAVDTIKEWIGKKLSNQAVFLRSLKKHRSKTAEYLEEQAEKIDGYFEKIKALEAYDIQDIAQLIRAYEGNAGRVYFETLFHCLRPFYDIKKRSFRPAADSFNAMLNYAYAILYSKVEKSLIIAGLDPFVGFLHRDDYNYKSLVYDFIEPYRIYAELAVFRLFSAKKVRQDHVDILENGVSLNAEGKQLLMEKYNQYLLEDKIRHKNRNTSRDTIIQLDAHEFAQKILAL